MRVCRCHQDGVAIRRRLTYKVRADHAAGTWLIVDHDCLLQDLASTHRDGAREHVSAPARVVWHHQTNRFIGVNPLSLNAQAKQGRGGKQR